MRPLELIKSPLHGLIELLQRGFGRLDVRLTSNEVEQLVIKIYNVMEARWRKYHTIEHVLDICETRDPIQVIAGLFHDVIYLQIDRRVHPKLRSYLADVSVNKKNGYSFEIPVPNGKFGSTLQLVNEVFGKSPGEVISPRRGGNEYLSALVAARILEDKLKVWDLLQVIACIEATIPFRTRSDEEESPVIQLEKRVRRYCQSHKISKSDDEFRNMTKSAVELANRDVISFAFKDPVHFNAKTWQLILEGNPVFKNPMFKTSQYLDALFKVEGFYETLKPHMIFQNCNHPDFNQEEILKMRARAAENLKVAREYFQTRIIANYVILAISELTGGDTALVLFIGKVENDPKVNSVLVEAFLDKSIPEVEDPKRSEVVLKMLGDVLYDAIHGDNKKETMSSYLFTRISTDDRKMLFDQIKQNLKNKSYYLKFLKSLDRELCYSLINAIAQMATTRKKEFQELEHSLSLV